MARSRSAALKERPARRVRTPSAETRRPADEPAPPLDAKPRAGSISLRLRGFLIFLARVNVLLALGMGTVTWMVQRMAGLAAEPVAPLAVALAFYAIYSLDRAADAAADGRTHPERARFARRNARLMAGTALGAYAAALALAASRGAMAFGAALLPIAALLVYSFPFVPAAMARRVGFRRLKEVLVVKNVVVAGTLSATPTLLVATAPGVGASARGPLVAMAIFLFGRWMINSIVFDVRDEAGDRVNGVRTVPVALGGARTLRLLHAANALLGAALLAAPALGLVPPPFALLALSSLYAWAYLRRMAAGRDVHFTCDVVADGELLVLSAVVLAAVALGIA